MKISLITNNARARKLVKLAKFSIWPVLFALLLAFSWQTALGNNEVTVNVSNGAICFPGWNGCPLNRLAHATVNVPEAGNYEVRTDVHLNSIDSQVDESFYFTFSQGSTITPSDPNAGDFYVVQDKPGQEFNLNAYAGTFALPAGDVDLNFHHYGNIWDQFSNFLNSTNSHTAESVAVTSLKLIKIHDQCELNQDPEAAITPEILTITLGEEAAFSAIPSTDPDGDPITYAWDIVDLGFTADTRDIFFTPDQVGEFEVILTINDQCSEDDEVATLIIEADQCLLNSDPAPAITPEDETIDLGDSVTYSSSNSTDPDSDPLSFRWLVDGVEKSTDASFEFTPTDSGDYTITLEAADLCSEAEITTNLTVEEPDICLGNESPAAFMTPFNPTVLENEVVNFSGLGSTDPEDDNLSYEWFLDDTSVSIAETYDFSSSIAGTFEVSLIVSDGCGSDTVTNVVVIETAQCVGNNEPVIDIVTTPTDIFIGGSVNLSGSGTQDIDTSDTLVFEWFVDDVSVSTDEDFIFTPSAIGTYTLKLKVGDGCSEVEQTVVITVSEIPTGTCTDNSLPVANTGNGISTLINQTIVLSGLASTDSDGDILTYHWEVPSIGHTSDNATTSISFATPIPENHIAILTVSDQCGSSSDTLEISVHNGGGGGPQCTSAAPTAVAGADFAVNINEVFTLDGTGSVDPEGDSLTYVWRIQAVNFEDHVATTTTSISQAGTYIAKLIVGDACSSDTDELVIEVIGGPPVCTGGSCTPPPPPVCTTNCGPIIPPPPTTTPPTVLGTSTTPFIPPTESPRAGAGLPIAQAGIGLLSGLLATLGSFTLLRRKEKTLA